MLIFADDTKNFKKIKTESDIHVQLFQKDLTSLSHWSVNNHLSFNISKFVFMHFHNKSNSEYTIHGNVIPHFSSCRTLESIYLIIYLGGYIIKLLPLKPINHYRLTTTYI